ncbi:MAG: VOC family protein [Armatimonadota bacterium]
MILGFHHATALASDASEVVSFVRDVLGLRLVKRTVADDDPTVGRLIFGDATGSPGSLLSFFVAPGFLEGRRGTGQAVQLVLSVPSGERDAWRQRLAEAGVEAREGSGDTLFFTGPDGIGFGLIAAGEDSAPRIHGAVLASCDPPATQEFLSRILGLTVAKGGYLYAGEDPLANLVLLHPGGAAVPEGVDGSGTWHHVAFRVGGLEGLDVVAGRLADAGWQHERAVQTWFETVSFRDPGGILVVVATEGPGMTADEPVDALGEGLRLPKRFEPYRDAIVQAVGPWVSGEGTQPPVA